MLLLLPVRVWRLLAAEEPGAKFVRAAALASTHARTSLGHSQAVLSCCVCPVCSEHALMAWAVCALWLALVVCVVTALHRARWCQRAVSVMM
jgi:hypothetical protein